MSAVYVQDNLKLQVSTPLGPNKLLLRALRGQRLFEDPALAIEDLIGTNNHCVRSLPRNYFRFRHGKPERHLGRWLVMAEIAHRGGDRRPLQEAIERTVSGPDSSRAAWTLASATS